MRPAPVTAMNKSDLTKALSKEYEGYTGRNPKTGGEIAVEPKKLPFFKVGKDIQDRLNH